MPVAGLFGDGSTPSAADRVRVVRELTNPAEPFLEISRKNEGNWQGNLDLESLVHADACFAVVPSNRYIAVDIDPPKRQRAGSDGHTAAQFRVEEIVQAAYESDIPAFTVSSGTGWHVWLKVGDKHRAVVERILVALRALPGVDVRRGKRRPIRPPYTRHRTSALVRAMPTSDPSRVIEAPAPPKERLRRFASAIAMLAPADGHHRSAATSTSNFGLPRPLPRQLCETVESIGPPRGQRSETVWSIVRTVVGHGLTDDQYCELIDGTWIAKRCREKRRGDWRAYAKAEFERAFQDLADKEPRLRIDQPLMERAQQAAAALHSDLGRSLGRWWNEGGHAVIDVVLELVAVRGTDTVHLSVRDAADRAGISRSAAHRHLRHLEAAGFIAIADPDDRRLARLITLRWEHLPNQTHWPTPSTPSGRGPECPTSWVWRMRNTDVFAHDGLGKRGWTAWARLLHAADATVPIVLRRQLTNLGLLNAKGYATTDPDRFKEAAELCGVAGTGRLREIRHQHERERWAPIAAVLTQQSR